MDWLDCIEDGKENKRRWRGEKRKRVDVVCLL